MEEDYLNVDWGGWVGLDGGVGGWEGEVGGYQRWIALWPVRQSKDYLGVGGIRGYIQDLRI